MRRVRSAMALRVEPLERRLALAVAAQYFVNQAPRLQPGDAPLAGYAGGDRDRVDILWQTVPAGDGVSDTFAVEWRPLGAAAWNAAAAGRVIDT
ncbi:MAG: hypothetical protein ACKO40_08665, partial [Planctomycetaceae bacterium]